MSVLRKYRTYPRLAAVGAGETEYRTLTPGNPLYVFPDTVSDVTEVVASLPSCTAGRVVPVALLVCDTPNKRYDPWPVYVMVRSCKPWGRFEKLYLPVASVWALVLVKSSTVTVTPLLSVSVLVLSSQS